MHIDMGKMDWKELRKQKLALLKAMTASEAIGHNIDGLNGILNLIDHIQDEAVKQLNEKEVFGKDFGKDPVKDQVG